MTLERHTTMNRNCNEIGCVFKSRLKVVRVGADATKCGRAFQACAAVTGNARSPSAEQRVVGTISCDVAAESLCRRVMTSDTHWKLLARCRCSPPSSDW